MIASSDCVNREVGDHLGVIGRAGKAVVCVPVRSTLGPFGVHAIDEGDGVDDFVSFYPRLDQYRISMDSRPGNGLQEFPDVRANNRHTGEREREISGLALFLLN